MTRIAAFALAGLLSFPTVVNAAERWRLASVPLDMPMDDGLEDQALEGLRLDPAAAKLPPKVSLEALSGEGEGRSR